MSKNEDKRKVNVLFINKTPDGKNNFCGRNIYKYRKQMKISQRIFAERLQLLGLDVDKNAIQRMESGQRFITDIELVYISQALNKEIGELFEK